MLNRKLFAVYHSDPPHFVVRPQQYYQAETHKSVTMHCTAEGSPRPTLEWRKVGGGGEFPSVDRSLEDEGNLTIVNLSREDSGVYECIARNIATSIIASTTLLVEIGRSWLGYFKGFWFFFVQQCD